MDEHGLAQRFTTGGKSAGYVLQEVSLRIPSTYESRFMSFSARLYAVTAGGAIGNQTAGFSHGATPSAEDWDLTASGHVLLQPNSQYIVQVLCDSGCANDNYIAFAATTSNGEDSDVNSDPSGVAWTLANNFQRRSDDWENNGTRSLVMAVKGRYAVPPLRPDLTVSSIADTAGALLLEWEINGVTGNAARTPTQGMEYRVKESSAGSFTGLWLSIPSSKPGEANDESYRLTSLTNGLSHDVQVRALNQDGPSGASATASAVVGEQLGVCSRTRAVQTALATAAGVNDCAGVTSARLSGIQSLSIQNAGTVLKSGDFDGLTSLTLLYLSNIGLTALPGGVFDDLSSLQTLYLSNNDLAGLPGGVFDDLTSLEVLYLNGNQLTGLSNRLFSQVPLKSLWLNNNLLDELHPDVFATLTSLQALLLSHNQLSDLPAGLFEDLSQLSTLQTEGNTVDPLPLSVDLERAGQSGFRAVAPVGAPFDIVLPVSVTNGSIAGGAATITIPTGDVESSVLTVTRSVGASAATTVDIGTVPALPANHSGYGLSKAAGLPLTMPGLTVTPTTLTVDEGGGGTYTVVLDTQPSATVTVTIGGTTGTDVSVGDATLEFTTGDWATAQTVTVSAAEDADAVNDTVTLTHTPTGGGYDGVAVDSVEVTVLDDDAVVTIAADSTSAIYAEDSADFTLTRTGAIADPLAVTVNLTQSQDYLTAANRSRTVVFAAGSTTAALRIPASQFRQLASGTVPEKGTLTATVAAGTGYDVGTTNAAAVDILIAATIRIEESSYTVSEEGGGLLTVTVVARTGEGAPRPTATISFGLGTFATGSATSPEDYQARSEFLNFRSTDFTADGTVYEARTSLDITIDDDIVADSGETFDIRLQGAPGLHVKYWWNFVNSAGQRCGPTCVAEVTITDTDTDAPAGVSVTPTTLTVDEGGGGTYTVVLDTRPSGTVTVTVGGTPGTDVSVDDATLEFTTGDWATAQTVMVSAAEDADAVNDTVTLTHTPTGGGYDGVSGASVAVTVLDDEALVTIAADSPSAIYAEDSADFTLTRTGAVADPLAVTVNLTQSQDYLAAANRSRTVVFAPDSATATLRVPANQFRQLASGTVPEKGTLTATVAAGSDYVVGTPNAAAVDILIAATIRIEESSYTVSEEGGSLLTVTVVARTGEGAPQPTGTIFVTLGTFATGSATSPEDYQSSSEVLRFRSSDFTADGTVFEARKSIEITINDDSVVDSGETFEIRLQGAPGLPIKYWYNFVNTAGQRCGPTCAVTATITDTDRGVTVSATTLDLDEGDDATYTVVLDTQPTGTVTVTIGGTSGTDVSVGDATLEFTAGDWATAQTVTVSAAEDSDTANDTVSLTHSAASTDSDYDGIAIAGVEVTVNDNDTAQVTEVRVVPGNAQLVVDWKAVDNATGYKVQWKSGAQDYNTGDRQATVTPGSTTSHTIGSLANGTEYTVRVIATRTGANDGTPSVEAKGTPAEPTGAVTVSKMALTVTEEDTTGDTYTVVLDSQPSADVTVTVAGHSGTDVTPNPTTLTFTSTTWATAQTVTVTAGDDADATNDTVSLTHSATSTDSDYDGITIAGVTVTVADNDRPVVTISPDVETAISNLDHFLFDVPVPTYTLTRTGSTAHPLRVDLQIPQNPFVYRPNGETVTIPAGETSKQVKFDTISYYYSQEAGTLTVEVADRDRYVVGTPATASISMQRIESPITLELKDGPSFEVSEGAGTVTFTVVATTAAGLPAPSRRWETHETWRMNWGLITFAGGLGATANDDYVPFSQTRAVTGAWEADGDHFRHESTFDLEIIDDMIDEPDEGLTLILNESTQPFDWENYIHRVCPNVSCRHTVTIIDNDAVGVTVSKMALTVTEEDATGDSYTVVLDGQPAADVVVTVAGHAGTDVTPAPATLTFTDQNWDTAQTVTVTAGDDTDTVNDTVSLTHSAASTDSDYDDIAIAGVDVTVNDNDTARVTEVRVVPGNAQLVVDWKAVDNATGYKVQWKSGAQDYNTGDRQATVTSGSTTIHTIGSLANGTEYTVRVIATRTGANDGPPSAEVTDTPTMPTGPGVTVSATTLTVTEGTSATYTVVLDTQPTGPVTVTPSRSSGDADVTVSGALTFTPLTWSAPQTVTVTAGQDADGDDDAAVIGHAVSGADYVGVTAASVDVTVDDDETASTEVILAVDPAWANEGAELTNVRLTAELNEAPRSELTTVTVTVGDSGDSAVEGTDYQTIGELTLTIRAGQTSTFQTIQFRPVNDGTSEGDERISINGTTPVSSLTVTGTELVLFDDDLTRTVTLTVFPDSWAEGGGRKPVAVRAAADSGPYLIDTPVTVMVGVPGDSATDGTDYASVRSITFTISRGTTGGTGAFPFLPVNDSFGEGDETVSVWGSSTVPGVVVRGTELTITDDETASTEISLSVSPDNLGEGAGTTTLTVTGTLNNDPRSSPTSVTVMVGAPSDVAVEGADYETVNDFTLTIDAGRTTGTADFQLIPSADTIDEADEALTVTGTTASTGLTVTTTSVTIADDDAAPTVTLSLSDDSIGEAGGIATVTASLNHASSVPTTVTVSAEPVLPATSSDYSLSANRVLTIAADAIGSTGTVRIAGVDNDVDAPDKTVQVKGAAANSLGAADPADVELTIEDDDTRGVTVSTSTLDIPEGNSATYTVVLASQPSGDVTVTPARSSGDADVEVSGALTFTPLTWNAAQTVTVSAAQDSDALNDEAAIGHTVGGADYAGVTAGSVDVTVDDDETPSSGVTLSVFPDALGEGAGATPITVTAALNGGTREAATPVTVTVGSGTATADTDFEAVTGFTITIPADSASHTGSFVLTPTQDTVDEPDETVEVNGTTTIPDFAVTDAQVEIADDDAAPTVTLSLSDDSIGEAGGIATVTASLNHASSVPTTVTVSVAPDTPATSSDYSLSVNKVLTIAADATTSTGTVRIAGVDNDVDAPDKTVQVKGAAANSLGAADPADVELTIEDDDTRGVTVSTSTLEIPEGNSATYTVVLASEPSGNVTVTPSHSSGDADVTVSGALTFTALNWATAQTVTVSAAQDSDALNDEAAIGHAVGGADYAGVTAGSVDVTVDDDETPSSGVTLSVSPDAVSEGAGATPVTVTAALNGGTREAATPVTVTVGSGTATADTDFEAVSAFTITVPANSASHTGSFVLIPTQDTVDEPDETVEINGTTTIPDFAVTDAQVEIADDDAAPTVTLSLSDTSIGEAGGIATVTASLNHASSVPTAVTVSAEPVLPTTALDYSLSANKVLTIAADATGSTGTVRIAGVDNDVDAPDKTVQVKGAAVNSLGAADPADVELTIEDDDTRGVTVSTSTLDIPEGNSATYTVVLASQPSGNVTVTPSRSSGDADVTVSGALTFTALNWATAQTVTVSAAQDSDALNDEAAIGHAVSGADYAGETAGSVDVTVDDDETPSSGVTLSVSPDAVSEGAGATPITVTASLNGGTREAATPVAVTVGSGTATAGTDFETVTGFTITIPANSASHTGSFVLIPTQDTVDEPDETVEVNGTTTIPGDAVTGAQVEIADDDAASTVTLSLSDTSIGEAGGVATVTASLNHASSEPTTVTVSVAPDTPATSSDYSLSVNKVLTIAADATTSTGTVRIAGVDNDVDAPDKTVQVKGAAANSLGAAGPADVELTIEDDDTRGVTVSTSTLEIPEGNSATYTVVLASEPSGNVTVTPSHSSGDADVTVSGALTFTALNWAAPQTVTVSAAQDSDTLNDEAAIGHTVSGADYAGETAGSVDVTVDDDETPSSGVTLSVSPDAVSEGAGATPVTVTAALNGGTREAATPVTVTVGSGTATADTDFEAVTGFTITIPANSASHTGSFNLTPTQDTVDEPDETVEVNGTTTIPDFAVTDAQVEIADDDAAPTVTLSLSDTSIGEAGGIATVTAIVWTMHRVNRRP